MRTILKTLNKMNCSGRHDGIAGLKPASARSTGGDARRGALSKGVPLLAALLLAACGTDPALVALRNAEGPALTSRTWLQPTERTNVPGHSFEADSLCKFEPDGTGTLSSRRFGYTQPGAMLGETMGCGAYNEVISWPISWEPLGKGEFAVTCEDGSTSTGANYTNGKPLDLVSARCSGNTLVLHYKNNISVRYQALHPGDPRLSLSRAEVSRQTAKWASQGPALLARTGNGRPAAPTTDDLVRAVGNEGLTMSYQDSKRRAQENGGTTRVTVLDSSGNVIFSRNDAHSKP